jgi:uncharacterized membrane protein
MKQKRHHDHWKRSFVKTITYRLVIVILVYIVSYYVTHQSKEALAITGWNALLATIIYYIHERIWSRIHWGRNL